MIRNILAKRKVKAASINPTPAMQEERIRSTLTSKGLSKNEIEAAVAKWKKDRAEMGFN